MGRVRAVVLALLLAGAFLSSGGAYGYTVSELEGVVELRPSGGLWRPASLDEAVEVGGSLRSLTGGATLSLGEAAFLRIDQKSELTRLEAGLEVSRGRFYAHSSELFVAIGGELYLMGEGRIDLLEDGMRRVAVFEGEALFNRAGELVIVEPGEQLVFSLEDESVLKSTYFERDPWYRGLAALASGRGTVESFYGQVQLGEQGAWRDAALGDTFTPGMSARTAEGAWLELRFDDGNLIRLQAQSEITLKQLEDYSDGSRRTVLELHRGSVWAVVETKGQPFEIETPGLVAGVRGTKFRLDAAENGRPPHLKVFEGVVVGLTETWGERVQAGESFTPEEGVAALEPDSSDAFNLELDEVPPEERDPSDLIPPVRAGRGARSALQRRLSAARQR